MAEYFTTDHRKIRQWIEEHGGKPAVINHFTEPVKVPDNILHIAFSVKNPTLKVIDWEEFFDRFEHLRLGFVYDDVVRPGEEDFAFRFIDRDIARAKYPSETDAPDSGYDDELKERLYPDASSQNI